MELWKEPIKQSRRFEHQKRFVNHSTLSTHTYLSEAEMDNHGFATLPLLDGSYAMPADVATKLLEHARDLAWLQSP